MVRSMCGVKLVDRKNTEELMKMLGLKETLDKMAKANGVRWYRHVVRRDDESILKKAMMFEVNGPRKRGRPKQIWKKQVEENIKKIGLRVEEATDRARWREGVGAIAEGMRCIRPPSDTRKNRIKTGRWWWYTALRGVERNFWREEGRIISTLFSRVVFFFFFFRTNLKLIEKQKRF